jgi:SSS family solute:Na+ symporter
MLLKKDFEKCLTFFFERSTQTFPFDAPDSNRGKSNGSLKSQMGGTLAALINHISPMSLRKSKNKESQMTIGWIDGFILIFYLVAMISVGVYFSRKNKNIEQYFIGGRSFSGWVIGLGMVGTSISSVTFVAYPADAFKTTWIRYIPNLALPVATLIAAYLILPLFRKCNYYSVYEYLEERFGHSVRAYSSVTFLISSIVRISVILYLLTVLIYNMAGISPVNCILITGICVMIYTVLGGISAVLWTDVIQTILLFLGGIVCVGAIIFKLPGGLSEILDIGAQTHKLSFCDVSKTGEFIPLPWGFAMQVKTFTMMFLMGITMWLTEYSGNQALVQKYFASKSIHETRKAILVKVTASMPIWAFYMFIGTAMFVFFTKFPNNTAKEIMNGTRKAEEILPFFVVNYLPPGVIGLIIAAALSAAMGALSNTINSISTVFVVDTYKRYLVKNKSGKHYLFMSWATSFTASVLMILGAIILTKAKTQTIQDTGLIISSILGAGVLGIYLLGFFTKVGDSRSIWVGIICTILFTCWTILANRDLLPSWLSYKYDLYYTMIFSNVIMFVTSLASALIIGRREPLPKRLTLYDTISEQKDTDKSVCNTLK